MAELTGLEPATPCVTGKCSNQLSYSSIKLSNLVVAERFELSTHP